MSKPEKTVDTAPEVRIVPAKRKRSRLGCLLHVLFVILVSTVVFLLAVSVFGAVAAAFYWSWFLPDHLTTRYLPPVQKKYGFDDMSFQIRRLGLTGADLAELRIGDGAGGELRVDSIRADFRPTLLPDHRTLLLTVHDVTLSGVEVEGVMKKGRFHLAGIDLAKIRAAVARAVKEAAEAAGHGKRLPFDIRFEVRLEKIVLNSVQVRLDWERKRLSVPIDAVLTPGDPAWNTIHAAVKLAPRGQAMTVQLDFNRLTRKLSARADSTVRLETLADLTGFQPAGTLKFECELDAESVDGELRLAGMLHTILDFSANSGLPVSFEKPLDINQKFSLNYRIADGTFRALLSGDCPLPPLSFSRDTVRLTKIDPANWRLVFSGTSKSVKLEDAELTTGSARIEAYGCRFDAPLVRLYKAGENFLFSVSGMTLTEAARKLEIRDMSLTVPLPPTETHPGVFRAGTILWGGREYGKIDSNFLVEGHDIKLRGNADSPLAPGAGINFRGTVEPRNGAAPDLFFEVNLPTYTPPTPLKLADYVPGMGQATGNASLALGGAIRFENGKLSTGAHLYLTDGMFRMPENDFTLEGVMLDVRFDDLIAASTPSAQKLQIKKMTAGKVAVSDIKVKFQIESREMTVIESAEFKWCGGELYMRAMPIRTNQQTWQTVFQCENLNFAEFLMETGLSGSAATGDGALFGKLPIRVSRRNGIAIDGGYLYSRPGLESTLKLADPDRLMTGSGAVMQQAQIEFASEALRDFVYNWVKLSLNTDNGTLAVALQLDGRPAGPLPFTTDEETGQLRRDPNGRANFQGIQLNINTRMPLNQFLKFNEKLQKLIKE